MKTCTAIALLCSTATSAFQLHCNTPRFRTVLGSVNRADDELVVNFHHVEHQAPADVVTRQSFLAQALVATTLPSLLQTAPAFAADVAGE